MSKPKSIFKARRNRTGPILDREPARKASPPDRIRVWFRRVNEDGRARFFSLDVAPWLARYHRAYRNDNAA